MNRFSRNRHRHDANHNAIVARLRELGCSVRDTSQIGDNGPDIICGVLGNDYSVEIKAPGKGLSDEQQDFHDAWRGARPVVLWTLDQAVAWVQSVRRRLIGAA